MMMEEGRMYGGNDEDSESDEIFPASNTETAYREAREALLKRRMRSLEAMEAIAVC